jgi:hypothetical protein
VKRGRVEKGMERERDRDGGGGGQRWKGRGTERSLERTRE